MEAFERLAYYPVPYIEIDTRIDPAGDIIVRHDPLPREILVDKLTLNRALEIFAAKSLDYQCICIDIKDYGHEALHLELVRKHGLEHRTVFIAWAPQVLWRLSKLGTKAPLLLSCLNLKTLDIVGCSIDWLLRSCDAEFGSFRLLGSNRICLAPPEPDHGKYHFVVSTGLPSAYIDILAASKGGIGVPKQLLGSSLIKWCQKNRAEFMVVLNEWRERIPAIREIRWCRCRLLR